ncbi:hypothetical protein AYL99_11924 [Fonsecaea erecta]|uniref:Reverse transcriptase/retrotransposon-derived protein RNase H-like domain-containing protein n=1 Tax=Fonsecaea erecta TaxID=1367422 RepID=A0A178Z284_9EURO|nr:hypothetical protein AYL99_11924 [Fonsecaea erecta]OAP53902.1 hypothetical protein AYL99_11924 [Fonsecaea erecta]
MIALQFPEGVQLLETSRGLFGRKGSPAQANARRDYTSKRSIHEFATPEEIKATREAFELLKRLMVSAPVLAYPDFKRGGFILFVDGSEEMGFAVAIHQKDDKGMGHPILFMSRTLSPPEKNYWPTELETAALIWAL